ncbi:MAG: hypothetical protein OEW43_04870, partial [Elusimicrobiota bacterium]|nr:hypothetical protein [Elusimicrobiota bacterium]
SLGIPTIQDNIAIVGINKENRLILNNMDENFKAKSFDISRIQEMPISVTKNKQEMEWTDFALVLYQALIPRLEGYGAMVPGLSVLIDGSEEYGGVPIESNISSSAAIEESQIYAVEALLGIRGQMTGGEVIEIGREAEAKIGFPCGKLDQGSSTVGRVSVPFGQMVGAAIDCVPRLDDQGRDKTVIEPFEVPSILEAILVYTGPKGEAQKEYNIRVIEGELGSWILAQKFMNEATPSQCPWLDPQAVRITGYADINPDHNGKPYLYNCNKLENLEESSYPVFFKPAFFSRTFLGNAGVRVTEDELTKWVKENLPTAVTKEELIENYGLPEEFFDKVTKNARGIIVDVDNITYNLQGTVLHAIGEQDRAEEIIQALKDATTTAGEEQAAALERFGRLQRAGYMSLWYNYRNSTPNINAVADWAMEQSWCLAPRHFGAGWGGWMQIWIKPGRYSEAEASLKKFLKKQKWYKNVAKSNRLSVKKQLKRGIMPFKPGAPASVLGTDTTALTSSARGVSLKPKRPFTGLLLLLFGGLVISLGIISDAMASSGKDVSNEGWEWWACFLILALPVAIVTVISYAFTGVNPIKGIINQIKGRKGKNNSIHLVLLGAGILLFKDSIMGPISVLGASIGENTISQKPFLIFTLLVGSLGLALAMKSNHIASWVKNRWANRGKMDSEKTSSEKTDTGGKDKSKKRSFMSILLGGLGILLVMSSDVFGAVGEIIKSGQHAGWGNIAGFPFGLGLWVVLACAVAVVGVSAVYQKVSLAGTGLVEVEQVRLPQVLGLERRPWKVAPTRVWQALARLFEGGRGFVAAIF